MAGTAAGQAAPGAAGVATVPDADLAHAAALGDRDAFEQIVRRHGQALYRYARRSLPDAGDAQDAVQETLVAAWRNIGTFEGRSSLKTWLFSLLTRKITDIRRKRRGIPVEDDLLDRPAGGADDPYAAATRSELLRALDSALHELPQRQRACWILVEVEGLTQAEVAEVLSMTPDAVRGHLYRARRGLSDRMERWR